jgi:hypothetical protein
MTDELYESPEKIAEAGERLYQERFREKLEQSHRGHFCAIDVLSGQAYVHEEAAAAIATARQHAPTGIFHLIRIGAPGAFQVSDRAHLHGFGTRLP